MQAITEMKCEPIYEWIKEQFAERLKFPTMREIVDAGLASSTSQANARIRQMYEMGWLDRRQVGSTWQYSIKGATVVYNAEALSSLSEVEGGDAIVD